MSTDDAPIAQHTAITSLPDSLLQHIIIEVASHVLAWTVTKGWGWGKQRLAKRKDLEHLFVAGTPLRTLLTQAASRLGTKAQASQIEQSALRAFLSSPEVVAILKGYYSSRMISATPTVTHEHLFVAAFIRHMNLVDNRKEFEQVAKELFADLLIAADSVLETAIDNGLLPAHEARSEARFQTLHAQLLSLNRQLELLIRSAPTPRAVEQFVSQYHVAAMQRFKSIPLPSVDSQKRIEIDKIYVRPTLHSFSTQSDHKYSIEFSSVLTHSDRTIILGSPGGGKTTAATVLCYELLRHKQGDSTVRVPVPVFVTLREYAIWTGKHSKHFSESIAAHCTLQTRASADLIHYMLSMGHLYVVFDGLDELTDTSVRREVRDQVESFCASYPATPVLVTSRVVGYSNAPLSDAVFDTLDIRDFDAGQVREYSSKWFGLHYAAEREVAARLAQSFMSESQLVADVRANPLMLSLMCSLYREERYIPRNRPDVYEKCATLLFEKWDTSRGIQSSLPFEAHTMSAIRYLAHWIYCDDELQKGVTESDIIKATGSYLFPSYYEVEQEALYDARKFVEHCRGRAWVFTNTGATESNEQLYQFTHRTFLEYFTAAYIVQENTDPGLLMKSLLPRLELYQWDMVGQLAVQLVHKQSARGADGAMGALLSRAEQCGDTSKKVALLHFAARSLGYIVPTADMVKRIATACVAACVEYIVSSLAKRSLAVDDNIGVTPCDAIEQLRRSRTENARACISSMVDMLNQYINGDDHNSAMAAMELALTIPRMSRVYSVERVPFIDSLTREKMDQTQTGVLAAAIKNSMSCAMLAYRDGLCSIEDVVESHGFCSLFGDIPYVAMPGTTSWSLAALIIYSVLDHTTGGANLIVPTYSHDLDYMYYMYCSNKPPYTAGTRSPSGWLAYTMDQFRTRPASHDAHLNYEQAGAAILSLLILAEKDGAAATLEIKEHSRDLPSLLVIALDTIRARRLQEGAHEVIARLGHVVDSESLSILERWVTNDISFVT